MIEHQRLPLFTRYPRVGKTKTRLIPYLGAAGAAKLQRQLTPYVIRQVSHPQVDLEVQFTGGPLSQMRHWLGPHLSYRPQTAGDLGMRLTAAFAASFQAETAAALRKRLVLAIGADCPALGRGHIQQALTQLRQRDVVLGPIQNSGYYLIGLKQLYPPLFAHIAWGTDQLLDQTLERIRQLGLSVSQLETLQDIDRPEDTALWLKRCPPLLS